MWEFLCANTASAGGYLPSSRASQLLFTIYSSFNWFSQPVKQSRWSHKLVSWSSRSFLRKHNTLYTHFLFKWVILLMICLVQWSYIAYHWFTSTSFPVTWMTLFCCCCFSLQILCNSHGHMCFGFNSPGKHEKRDADNLASVCFLRKIMRAIATLSGRFFVRQISNIFNGVAQFPVAAQK